MPYATVSDVETRLGRTLTAGEASRAGALLDDAALLIDSYIGEQTVEPYPPAVVAVSANMTVRALSAGPAAVGMESGTEQTGPFARTVRYVPGAGDGGVWLSSQDKVMLRPLRGSTRSIPVTSERGYT